MRDAKLRERQSGFLVRVVDLLDRVDVRSSSQIETQVVFHGCPHDLLQEKGDGKEEASGA